MKDAIHRFFNQLWYGNLASLALLLWPLGLVVRFLTLRKRKRYLDKRRDCVRLPVPVIVVGNITVGGTGKTPLVVWLVQQLQQHGYRPGIVSRGYGSHAPHYPYLIQLQDTARIVGDEPLMLAQRTDVPVVIDPRRANAAQALLDQTDCDVIISDDGLQHYSLGRSYELVVLDGSRGIGNGQLLPAGPLRETVERLQTVDAVLVNGERTHASLVDGAVPAGFSMQIVPVGFHAIADDRPLDITDIRSRTNWIGVAGIGNPQRFFDTLAQLDIRFAPRSFADHHDYTADDFAGIEHAAILTTEKDAVKLRSLGINGWYLAVEARVQPELIDGILASLDRFKQRPHYRY